MKMPPISWSLAALRLQINGEALPIRTEQVVAHARGSPAAARINKPLIGRTYDLRACLSAQQSGREHSKAFGRKTDAQKWLDEVTAAVVTGQYVDPKAGQVTFRDYAERWRAIQVQRPARGRMSRRCSAATPIRRWGIAASRRSCPATYRRG